MRSLKDRIEAASKTIEDTPTWVNYNSRFCGGGVQRNQPNASPLKTSNVERTFFFDEKK